MVTIAAKATAGDVERYQELLRADWSRQTLDEVLSLLHKLVAAGLRPGTHSWQKVLALDTAKRACKESCVRNAD